jgi:hypothetical protein
LDCESQICLAVPRCGCGVSRKAIYPMDRLKRGDRAHGHLIDVNQAERDPAQSGDNQPPLSRGSALQPGSAPII